MNSRSCGQSGSDSKHKGDFRSGLDFHSKDVSIVGFTHEEFAGKRNILAVMSIALHKDMMKPYALLSADRVYFKVFIPENYPFGAPRIQLINPELNHPSIDKEGFYCVEALEREWTAASHIEHLLRIILSEIEHPIVDP